MAERKTISSERDWWLGIWDWAAELTAQCGLEAQVTLVRDNQRGAWKTEVRLLNVVDGRPAGVALKRKGTWPNAERKDLAAHLLNETIKLDAMAQQDALNLLKKLP